MSCALPVWLREATCEDGDNDLRENFRGYSRAVHSGYHLQLLWGTKPRWISVLSSRSRHSGMGAEPVVAMRILGEARHSTRCLGVSSLHPGCSELRGPLRQSSRRGVGGIHRTYPSLSLHRDTGGCISHTLTSRQGHEAGETGTDHWSGAPPSLHIDPGDACLRMLPWNQTSEFSCWVIGLWVSGDDAARHGVLATSHLCRLELPQGFMFWTYSCL